MRILPGRTTSWIYARLLPAKVIAATTSARCSSLQISGPRSLFSAWSLLCLIKSSTCTAQLNGTITGIPRLSLL
ncbi:hypothetical protein B0H10DRAFT_2036179 [Mycena sp. CBHHK59/15]|nr:hypothetical protein B0H10DRAFT_2036179 [Mycena sp. CBHHK59/15]